MSTKKDIHLYTASTMNGWKPVIFLEEAEIEYDLTSVDLAKKEQKTPEFLKINPNGRIPAIIDRSNNDFAVFESGAILWYLAEKYNKFLPQNAKEKSIALQWLMFQMSAVGPIMGQAMFFQRIAPSNGEHNTFSIDRFVTEGRRLFEVLNSHLKVSKYLANDEYGIADMATYPWARAYFWAKISIEGLPYLQDWFARIDSREATQRALNIPKPVEAFFGRGDQQKQEQEVANAFKTDVRKK